MKTFQQIVNEIAGAPGKSAKNTIGYVLYDGAEGQLYLEAGGPWLEYSQASKKLTALLNKDEDAYGDLGIGWRDSENHFWAVDSKGKKTSRLSR